MSSKKCAVWEIPPEEQVMMPEAEIGGKFFNHYILCTNSKQVEVNSEMVNLAIPRVVSKCKDALFSSRFVKKYDNTTRFALRYSFEDDD
jgi:hypothetical protein